MQDLIAVMQLVTTVQEMYIRNAEIVQNRIYIQVVM